MLFLELKKILSLPRALPSPYRGHPRFFFDLQSVPAGASYRFDGCKRQMTAFHPQLVFQYTLGGIGRFTKNDSSHKLEAGQAFFAIIPSAHVYELPKKSPGWRFFFLTLQKHAVVSRLEGVLKNHSGVVRLNDEHPMVLKSIDLIRRTQASLFLDNLDEEAHLFDWMCHAERVLREEFPPYKEKELWLSHARNYIEQDIRKAVSVTELAEQRGMSRTHYTRLFQEKTGESPAAYIAKVRMHHVSEALRCTRDTLEKIAADYGYADSTHLSKAFRRAYDITPGRFREAGF